MKKQQGLTLIEVLIALALGIFIIAATLMLFINTLKSSSDTIKAVRLNHDLEMALNLMSNDIKRAGYWSGARLDASSYANPFTIDALNTSTATRTNIQILTSGTTTVASPGTCILYTYDGLLNNTATPPPVNTVPNGTVDTNEHYGFRLNNGTIEMRVAGALTTDCTTNGNSNSWQSLIDNNNITITNLQFSFFAMGNLTGTSRCWNVTTTATTNSNTTLDCAGITNSPTPTTANPHGIVVRRVVNITLTGQLVNDPSVTKTISTTVEVRNNRLYQKTS
jgi:type IV pilus assembly protein PilW